MSWGGWEYRRVPAVGSDPLIDLLNDLGRDGWEAVTVYHEVIGVSSFRRTAEEPTIDCILLKRPRATERAVDVAHTWERSSIRYDTHPPVWDWTCSRCGAVREKRQHQPLTADGGTCPGEHPRAHPSSASEERRRGEEWGSRQE